MPKTQEVSQKVTWYQTLSIIFEIYFKRTILWSLVVQIYRLFDFVSNWLLTTNHRRLAIMYFYFIFLTSFCGLLLATGIRIELATPGYSIMNNNSEKYLTVISLHGIVMVFFVVIPTLFGAFGNFLLPTQLGVRDVAFPRLNSFMFWVTPSGFILLMHIFLMDKGVDVFNLNFKGGISSTVSFVKKFNININLDISRPMEPTAAKVWEIEKEIRRRWNLPTHITKYKDWILNVNFKKKIDPKFNGKINAEILFKNIEALKNADSIFNVKNIKNFVNSKIIFNNINLKVSTWVSNQLIPGWAFITPYTTKLKFTAIGKVDIALVVVFAAGLGSIISALNYLITYKCVTPSSSKNRKELRSFFVDGLLVASRMMLAANPALLIAILLLLSDRHLNTSVFDYSGGGDAVLFQHLFWFFGHPEVYIIIIPCFGIVNSLLPYYLRKRLSGRLSLQFSMYTIAFMGFAVWGHHMYMVGLANTTRTLYSTMTVMISVPASTKVLHWCVTIINSSRVIDVPLIFLLAFIYFFTLGGLSGMAVAHIGYDVLFHDTFYVIGHFHVMFAGAAISCIFAAFYHYYSSIFGVKYNKTLAYIHFFFYFFGQIFTVVPMFWLGYAGMPRRIMDYPSHFAAWHSFISGGHILSVLGYLMFLITVVESFVKKQTSTDLMLGVPRINNRLSFYFYVINKQKLFDKIK